MELGKIGKRWFEINNYNHLSKDGFHLHFGIEISWDRTEHKNFEIYFFGFSFETYLE